jgi:hypothetical protein
VSVTTPSPADAGTSTVAPAPPAAPGESCPLCAAPLHPEQEWCVRCGAAARTRLAASPNWKGPTAALAAVAALSLGVLVAALVALAGGSSPTASTTVAVTTPLGASAPVQTSTSPASTSPGTSTSGTGASGTGTSTTSTSRTSTSGTSTSGATTPRSSKLRAVIPRKDVVPKHPGKKTPSASQYHIKLSPSAEAEIKRTVEKGLKKGESGTLVPGAGSR